MSQLTGRAVGDEHPCVITIRSRLLCDQLGRKMVVVVAEFVHFIDDSGPHEFEIAAR